MSNSALVAIVIIETNGCRFYTFPKDPKELERWIRIIRRADREPSLSSRICSCHFPDGKAKGPVREVKLPAVAATHSRSRTSSVVPDRDDAALAEALKEVEDLKRQLKSRSQVTPFSVKSLSSEEVGRETGLTDVATFQVLVNYVAGLKGSIKYHHGWRVEDITLEDQVFICLMKLRHNYPNFHLAKLFMCSRTTISNVVLTFVHVFHELLFPCLEKIPSAHKNSLSAPQSFKDFPNCRVIIDCSDIEIAMPELLKHQKQTYSVYRGMHSFKFLVGVSPNGAVTFCSGLYPGSFSDKAIVKESGILSQMVSGDVILADKGFLIRDLLPEGVHLNIPPFLNHGKLTASEAHQTEVIARNRIHVERAIGKIKGFKILSFIPSYLRCYADILVQLSCCLVNMQRPLFREASPESGCQDTQLCSGAGPSGATQPPEDD
ncbi:uncharacterized protein LOC125304889 [Alosa alosa]|uniref:uncharacterized protein LOC125304889 n=1 Tax=Alosa alosa TaxID=278164 RepID=UPI0020153411|nr:uncharacterized protein LOC125304889 [Alosa alosa]